MRVTRRTGQTTHLYQRAYPGLMLQPHEIERAVVITAHPDDVDFGAAGTVANLTDAGVVVTYCIVTDGQAGGHDVAVPREDMARIRRAEQTLAAGHVGVTDLTFLGMMDGSVEYSLDLRRALSTVIRRARPNVVISHNTQISLASAYASHPDHVATGQAAFAAVYPDSRNPFAFPELLPAGFEPWAVDELWVMNAEPATDTVDITDQIERKMMALLSHVSQHVDTTSLEQRMHDWFAHNARLGSLPEGRLAERFTVVDTR